MKTTTPQLENSMSSSFRYGATVAGLFTALVLSCFALSQRAYAQTDGDLGNANTAEGAGALASITTGGNNTALGANALASTTTTSWNTATGSQALKNNVGHNNTADGFQALVSNTGGGDNTGTGWRALVDNTTGSENTATGFQALLRNVSGSNNTATGSGALQNTTASDNTADGFQALKNNTTGTFNTATGFQALLSNTTGFHNTAIGDSTLGLMTTGARNIALGFAAGFNLSSGNDNIYIGNGSATSESGTIRIGTSATQSATPQTRTFIAGIRGTTTGSESTVPVVIDSNGQLGTSSSSRRFKDQIKPMDKASEAILALKPVTFHYKSDSTSTPQFGLIAEEVAEVNSDLVVRDEKGEIYTVRYEAVNAMLLNEFLKEHHQMQEQEATITDLKSTVTQQQKQIEALTTGLQKVSDQLELNKSAPQIVGNNQ